MERVAFYLRIFPGTEAEYDRRHAEVWPELVDEIRESGIRKLHRFRRGTDVWYYAECEPDAKTAFGVQGPEARQPALEPLLPRRHRPDHRRLRRASLVPPDLPGRRPSTRGTDDPQHFVVDPERADEYDARHADPWQT